MDGLAAFEVQTEFKRRLSGLRRLPRHERALAYRQAKDWHRTAMKAVREKRAMNRQAARQQMQERRRHLAGPSP